MTEPAEIAPERRRSFRSADGPGAECCGGSGGFGRRSADHVAVMARPRDRHTHDIANLCISHRSPFAAGAAENPTPTIVALAIRQADRIASELAAGNI